MSRQSLSETPWGGCCGLGVHQSQTCDAMATWKPLLRWPCEPKSCETVHVASGICRADRLPNGGCPWYANGPCTISLGAASLSLQNPVFASPQKWEAWLPPQVTSRNEIPGWSMGARSAPWLDQSERIPPACANIRHAIALTGQSGSRLRTNAKCLWLEGLEAPKSLGIASACPAKLVQSHLSGLRWGTCMQFELTATPCKQSLQQVLLDSRACREHNL